MIRGCGGTVQSLNHTTTTLDDNQQRTRGAVARVQRFVENRAMRPLKPLKVPNDQNFGIELELTSANYVTVESIADTVNRYGNAQVDVIHNYGQARSTSTNWKIVPDSSIMCSTSSPDCNKFELVSPILKGGKGLGQVNGILQQLSFLDPKLKVNKSMGYHLHVDIERFSHDELIKVCQNFIKYEDAIDALLPKSRRTGSEESNSFFKSNRQSIANQLNICRGLENHLHAHVSNRDCHDALKRTGTFDELAQYMNQHGRYYKINLQNIITGRQPTIEFRQHSATVSYDKVSAWVRFCIAFCVNSAKLAPPTPFGENRSVEYKLNALFQYVIKDRALRDFYMERREHLAIEGVGVDDGNNAPCCRECTSGRQCASSRRSKRIKS
jgi:hypothetical protein